MTESPATKEEAVAWRSTTGRRFFTRRAALRSSARAMIRGKCDCEYEHGAYDYRCKYHRVRNEAEAPLADRLVDRLVRLWSRR